MKVSLVIPAYNEEKYLGTCLGYVIKNAGDKFYEIIVIDNASVDATKKIAEDFSVRCPLVKVFTENKKGVTRARERGYQESSGEIIAFIDADTRMGPEWFYQIEKEFSNMRIGLLSGPYDYYDMSNIQKIGNFLYWNLLAYPISLITNSVSVGGNFAIRRSVLQKMEGFDTSIEFYGDDTNTARRAKEFGKVKFSLQFIIQTSARRFGKQGVVSTVITYILNFLSEVILHKPYTKKYEDHR